VKSGSISSKLEHKFLIFEKEFRIC
jgi:hypothetical protein